MIRLYYTGARTNLAPQPTATRSLGGYISSSVIPNGRVGSIFDSSVSEGEEDVRIIALKNEGTTELTGVTMWTALDDNPSTEVKIAIAPQMQDDCGDILLEKLDNGNSQPYFSVLNVQDQTTPLTLPNIAAGGFVGVYISRVRNTSEETLEQKTERLINEYENPETAQEQDKQDELSIFIDFA